MKDQDKTKEQFIAENEELRAADCGIGKCRSERRRAEEALRESETRFRSLFRDSVIGKAVVAPNGEIVQANPAYCEFLGYSEQELIGKTVQSITHPEDREGTAEVIRQALNSGPRSCVSKTLSP